MKLLFAESKLEGIETLKMELRSAHQINQQLRDEVSLVLLISFYSLFVEFQVPKNGLYYS